MACTALAVRFENRITVHIANTQRERERSVRCSSQVLFVRCRRIYLFTTIFASFLRATNTLLHFPFLFFYGRFQSFASTFKNLGCLVRALSLSVYTQRRHVIYLQITIVTTRICTFSSERMGEKIEFFATIVCQFTFGHNVRPKSQTLRKVATRTKDMRMKMVVLLLPRQHIRFIIVHRTQIHGHNLRSIHRSIDFLLATFIYRCIWLNFICFVCVFGYFAWLAGSLFIFVDVII